MRFRSLLTSAAVLAAAGAAWAQPAAPGAAYLLLELPSMRVVARQRPDVLEARVAPGSLMKAVTLIAAFEQGVAGPDTRVLCRRTIDVDGRSVTCVHPDLHRALSPAEALGHSCNVYFATLARRVNRGAIDRVLVGLGLQPSQASVPTVSVALGLRGVGATPPELLEAFCRLAGSSATRLRQPEAARDAVRLGLELAAASGTAAALGRAGFAALAKTGTAPMPGGGYQGIAAAIVNTEVPTHAVIVIAPGSTGAHAAQLAAGVLTFHGVPRPKVNPAGGSQDPHERRLRVGVAGRDGGYDVADMPVEEYVARGVSGEGDGRAPQAALEALAVTVRTFAAANRGRHETDGFDLCDLTHCLSLKPATRAARVAALVTDGRVLALNGRPAEVYLSAWCGGHTERPSRVWQGAADPPHLPARPDPACAGDEAWSSDLTEAQVRRVAEAARLRGARVDSVLVASRTASGRAERLAVGGLRPDTLSANVFRLLAGRLLGWQTVKSTLFDVERTSTGYRFRGKGLGHGVGLCVRGAAARAAAGAGAEAILGAYFPGLTLTPAVSRVRVLLPEADRAHLSEVRERAGRTLADLAADLDVAVPAELEVYFHPTVEAYARSTGMPWWTSGRARGTRIDLLPIGVLARKGTLDSTLRHELVHVLTDGALAGRPLWVREGLAQVKAGEFPIGAGGTDAAAGGRTARPACPSDSHLRDASSPDAWRLAYQAAARCVARALAAGTPWRDLR